MCLSRRCGGIRHLKKKTRLEQTRQQQQQYVEKYYFPDNINYALAARQNINAGPCLLTREDTPYIYTSLRMRHATGMLIVRMTSQHLFCRIAYFSLTSRCIPSRRPNSTSRPPGAPEKPKITACRGRASWDKSSTTGGFREAIAGGNGLPALLLCTASVGYIYAIYFEV